MALPAVTFNRAFVVLCEGSGDERFFLKLFEKRNIGRDIQIRTPSRGGGYAGGVTNFGAELNNMAVNESFLTNVKGVVVVGDSDTDPASSFAAVQAELRKSDGFGVPEVERVFARSHGDLPPVLIMMIPQGQSGTLESVCLEAAYAKFGLKVPLDAFVAATPAKDWEIGKQSKMRMQSILAATNKRRPDAGFAGHWNSADEYVIPVDHSCFDDIANFLDNQLGPLLLQVG